MEITTASGAPGKDLAMTQNDQKIKADILMRIRRDTRINDAMIDVKVKNGLVEIAGVVSSYTKKLAVQMKVKQTRGVVSVDNQLDVFYPQIYGIPPPQEIKKTAETILSANPDIDETKIDISIDAGIVTLKGSVKYFWQLHRVEEVISNIIGVVDLKNELAVVPSEKISDEIIAAQIMEELSDSEAVDQSQILVEVEDGAVILSGTVKTYAAENEAFEAVVHKPGVKHLTNNIAIAIEK